MIKEYIENIAEGNNLTINESYKVMRNIMSGEVNDHQISGLLMAMKTKR